MKDFKQDRGKRFGGHRGGFGKGRDRGPVTMHQAVCNQCGKSCEVPFKPTGDRPVYCNVCFGGKKETGNYRGGDRFPQKSFDSYKAPVKTDNDEMKRQFDMLNVKIDRIIKSLTPAVSVVPAKEEKKKKAKKAKKK